MTRRSTMTDIRKGLAGVVVDTTRISKVEPATNSLLYRGYPVQELAAHCSFEQVAYLLWHGELPTDEELAHFENQERAERRPADAVLRIVDALPVDAHPMDVLRTAVSAIGAADPAPDDHSADADLERSVRLLAQIPVLIAYDQRRRQGLDPVEPRDDLGLAENLLLMVHGERPTEADAKAMEVSLILYAEHSFNASTFTARVITSTLADLHSAVTGAIGALKGPLHGGANEAVLETLDEIGDAARVEVWLDAALAAKRKVMGFGHRVYRAGDSRVPTMKQALDDLVAVRVAGGGGAGESARRTMELYDALERGMAERTGILPNLDYPSGPAYALLGFETRAFTPLFVAARVVGWTAHIVEQRAANSLIRPLSEYDGPAERHLS
ncbi:bifunctional 2-methylcitrate synthase/citrate synthase [Clavibacter michiganensis subsp. insidiosus]|uniref:Citrate synthase n=2 Tax=Clavibacter michiganensis TaxID=28447 RepID=A0A0D5CIX3_9MICO|nr:bifunctional 2-methylcitrate synthase/citrate synthase [Clavibacter michiganensis]AJW79591.1 citrate synthase [Clavibacter michiganensis subsp. insidiosus]OQJ59367.1 citrate synthase/methylcitrate synthase [Clavibacter michiganensis subsp. insidiosus]RII87353.1 bifunctional 2-methylcitrate synthase/citrate synthase [Clavibacter michiganensis subsp. insidiosus]RIJ37127.1 bifunctional 2-methylcitrate synthase/citrate synthase [Clavibacter michiganensis subsp. insidiosus]RMC87837.1 bifunctiona